MELMKKICKSKLLYLVIYIITVILLYYSNLKLKLTEVGYNVENYTLLFFIIAAVISVILVLLFYFIEEKTNKNNIHKVFIVISLSIGMLYVFLAPMFTGSDEHNHYYRIYEITNFKLVTPVQNGILGGSLPSSLYKTFENNSGKLGNRNQYIKYNEIENMLKFELNKQEVEQYGAVWTKDYANTALYSPLQYTPQVVGMLIGRWLDLGPYILGMLARIFNLIFYTAICALGIKLLPKNKMFAMVLLLCPAIMSNAATLAADAFTTALVFLFIAYVLHFKYNNKIVSKIDYICIIGLIILICSCKIVYFPTVFLLFLIPKNKFKVKKWIFILLASLIGMMVSIIWLKQTDLFFEIYYTKSGMQKTFILSNIVEYVFIVLRTYSMYFSSLLQNLVVGNQMYHTQLVIYDIISFGYLVVLFISCINDEVENKMKIYEKILAVIILFGVIALITTAIYIQCTANFYSVGNSTVEGLQGRYYIPVFLLLIFILPKMKRIIADKLLLQLVLCISLPVFLTMLNQFI